MDELNNLFSILEDLRKKEEYFNKEILEEGATFQYTFGFLLGEYNLKNEYILNVLDIIKNNKQSDLLRYFSLSLRFYFQIMISKAVQHLDTINNKIKCLKIIKEWNDSDSLYFNSMISTENKIINKAKDMFSKSNLNDFLDYFSSEAINNNRFEILANWIDDRKFFENNYCYYCVFEAIYNFYCFEYLNLKGRNIKESPLFLYFENHNLSLLGDKNFTKYGLITLTNDFEPICTEHLECRIFYKSLNITLPLSRKIDNQLFKKFIELYNVGIIKQISFKPTLSEPYTGKISTDMALEDVEFGRLFDIELNDLIPTKLVSLDSDSLWINPVGQEITFEELKYDFDTFDDYIMTQAVHLKFFKKNNDFYIEHIDHEIIFYTYDEYDNRTYNIKAKGKVLKRQKTFKIDNSKIPFFTHGKPEFLIQILYTYFSRKELLDEYFSQYK
ncbi:MAG: hypothetical protein MR852_04715 [Treponema sp.]|nr:hypothetical protein [Treponema sp.]